LADRLLLPDDPFGYRLPSARLQAGQLLFIISIIARGEGWEEVVLERSYPFLHRPLVEFLMAIPLEQKLRIGETRSILRRALKDLLPPEIARRRGKGSTGETFCRGFAGVWPALKPMLADARIYERGYVERGPFLSALDQARHGRVLHVGALLQAISLEIWLRSLDYHSTRSAMWKTVPNNLHDSTAQTIS
jgi:asparagine synthetase B (glutamine-hydrolysing)